MLPVQTHYFRNQIVVRYIRWNLETKLQQQVKISLCRSYCLLKRTEMSRVVDVNRIPEQSVYHRDLTIENAE